MNEHTRLNLQNTLGQAALYLHKATLRTGSAEGLLQVSRFGNDSGPQAGTPEFVGAVGEADLASYCAIHNALADLKHAVRLLEETQKQIPVRR